MEPVIKAAHLAQILIAIIAILVFWLGVRKDSYLLKAAAVVLVISIFILCVFVFIASGI